MNMDQTPVYHAMCGGKTIDLVGVRTVNMCTPAGSADSKRVMVAACLMASSRQMNAMVFFKGESTYNLYIYVLTACHRFCPTIFLVK